ncbi:MAG: type IV secretory system conjugative DNA transfer family protein [Candidatus Bathyarchaeota archaeon]|nr:type IV secretory system conjugative DNA transfer family protein [Candidatus Bathyarchaeota archaeon]
MKEDQMDDYTKWYMWAYRQRYGEGSIEKGTGAPPTLVPYQPEVRQYWDKEKAVGVIEKDGKYIGIACLAAKEVVDKENYVRRFGLSFEKDVQWRAVASLLDHLSRSPVFKAVLITISKSPFKTEPDVPEELEGRRNWARRNYEYHKEKADTLRIQVNQQSQAHVMGGPYPKHLPKQMKEEEDYARRFLEQTKSLENEIKEHLKPYFLIKRNLFATALFFYVYTDAKESMADCLREIVSRKYSAKMEINKTYFVECSDVRDPIIVFNPEFFPFFREARRYYCLALSEDVAGFGSDKDVAIALKKMFTLVLELPTEEPIDEQIHIPGEEISKKGSRKALLGYVVKSVVKRKFMKRVVYFPLDVLTSHAIIFGKTRIGKSFLSLIIINEARANGIEVVVFDPHGTLSKRLKENDQLKIVYTRGRTDITNYLQEIYGEASVWPETNELRRLIVLDETRLLKAKNLVYCINELGKRGVGFILVTQYSTSIPPEVRNIGTYFIMAAMSETEMQRFKEVTLHPSSKLITRLPKACSYVFSPYWYPEPFFIKHRMMRI